MTVQIVSDGFATIERYLSIMPDRARKAASLAINQTADRSGMVLIREKMREEVAFPSGYLEKPNRLGVTKRASESDLEAVITGRDRPTSLARFAGGALGLRTAPIVRVNPGRAKTMARAFLVRLKAGAGPITDDNYNIGLALRLKPGEKVLNKTTMVPFAAGLYLLYGPGVGQVFRTVSASVSPDVADKFVDEFKRQFARLGGEE